MPRKHKGGDETTPATSEPGFLTSITNTLKKGVQKVQDVTGLSNVASTAQDTFGTTPDQVAKDMGTAPESGTTTTGGRRRRTMKKTKKTKKTMKRKH